MFVINKFGCDIDNSGNVYFSNNNKYYELFINNRNELFCEEGMTKEIEELEEIDIEREKRNTKFTKLFLYNGDDTLHSLAEKKLSEQIREDADIEQSIDKNQEIEEDDYEINVKKEYFYEDIDGDVDEYINDSDEDDKYYDEPYFIFGYEGNTEGKNKIKYTNETMALYETLIYKTNDDENKLIFKTKLVNDSPIYRLCIFTDGTIKFRAIGNKESVYQLDKLIHS